MCVKRSSIIVGLLIISSLFFLRCSSGKDVSSEMRVQVLNNLGKYLQEEEESSVKAEEEWKKRAAEENLKEMGDVQSG
mgnify:FL=1